MVLFLLIRGLRTCPRDSVPLGTTKGVIFDLSASQRPRENAVTAFWDSLLSWKPVSVIPTFCKTMKPSTSWGFPSSSHNLANASESENGLTPKTATASSGPKPTSTNPPFSIVTFNPLYQRTGFPVRFLECRFGLPIDATTSSWLIPKCSGPTASYGAIIMLIFPTTLCHKCNRAFPVLLHYTC